MLISLWHNVPVSVRELLKKRRKDILRLAAENGTGNVRIFGSVVRGKEGQKSDIDFLVTLNESVSLLDLIGLQQALEDLLNRKVDVVSDRALSPYIRDHVLSEAESL